MKSPLILMLFMILFSSAVIAQTTANDIAVQRTYKVGEFPGVVGVPPWPVGDCQNRALQ